MERARLLLATSERYRMMAGTITDQDIARRLLDYADELRVKAFELQGTDRDAGADSLPER